MISYFEPESSEHLRDCLRDSAAEKRRIGVFGWNSKGCLAGSSDNHETVVSTRSLRRILRYEPADLTISVEAGVPFVDLQAELARHGQMLPLDGAFADQGTVGGLIASGIAGPFHRGYGTARDLVIGMRFATLDGRLSDTGGMVVKNVAGLDISKLMIGSFGTLAAITSVNFKVLPKPQETRTFLFNVETAGEAAAIVSGVRTSRLGALALEVLNPPLSQDFHQQGFIVVAAFAGNHRVMARLGRELANYGPRQELGGPGEDLFWKTLRLVTAGHLGCSEGASVVRIQTPISESLNVLEVTGDAPAHFGIGVSRCWFSDPQSARQCLHEAHARNWIALVEASAPDAKKSLDLWPKPGGDFAIMERVKRMFDPEGLLNRGRLYNRI